MKAQTISSFGDYSVFKTEEVPIPKVKAGYIGEAHKLMESGKAIGKIVVEI
ncbi:MAG: hypothetical protein LEGION0403_FIIPPAGN_00471 [Legionella sp.]|uniref:hypothetical protein n=1 Tax=Legionella sp. TaxID=459 RepID=UPI003D0AEC28